MEEADLADAADKTKFPILGSLYRCVRFHLGSLAMGSFILTLISVLRAVLAYIDAKTKDMQGANNMLKYALKCAPRLQPHPCPYPQAYPYAYS